MAEEIARRAEAAPDEAAVARAHAIYTPLMLTFYDVLVHGLSNRLAWRCPTRRLLEPYRANLSDNHLDAGVGTGFFLDRTGASRLGRLVLIDINRMPRTGRAKARPLQACALSSEPARSDQARRGALRFCRPHLCAALPARPHG